MVDVSLIIFIQILGHGFTYFSIFTPKMGEMIPNLTCAYFFKGVGKKTPTRFNMLEIEIIVLQKNWKNLPGGTLELVNVVLDVKLLFLFVVGRVFSVEPAVEFCRGVPPSLKLTNIAPEN